MKTFTTYIISCLSSLLLVATLSVYDADGAEWLPDRCNTV